MDTVSHRDPATSRVCPGVFRRPHKRITDAEKEITRLLREWSPVHRWISSTRRIIDCDDVNEGSCPRESFKMSSRFFKEVDKLRSENERQGNFTIVQKTWVFQKNFAVVLCGNSGAEWVNSSCRSKKFSVNLFIPKRDLNLLEFCSNIVDGFPNEKYYNISELLDRTTLVENKYSEDSVIFRVTWTKFLLKMANSN